MYEFLIDRLRCIAEKGPGLVTYCSKRTLTEAADAIETISASNKQVTEALQRNGFGSFEELLASNKQVKAERDAIKQQHDGVAEAFRLLSDKFEDVSAERDAAAARLKEWERYRRDIMFQGHIPPAKWNGSEGN